MSLRKAILARAKPALESEVEELVTTVIKHEDDPIPTEDNPMEMPDGDFLSHEVSAVEPDIMGEEIISDDPVTNIADVYTDVGRIVEESFDEGGLGMEAAQILNLFSYWHNVPVKASVSTESYGTTGLYESRVALEGIKEVLAQWWVTMKEWLKKARDQITEWAGQLVVKLTDLKGKGEALKEKANNAQPGSGEIEYPRKHLLMIGGQVPNVVSAFTELVKFAETAYQGVIELGFDNATRVGSILSTFQLSGENSLTNLVQKLQTEANVPAEAYGHLLVNRQTSGSIFEKLLAGNSGLNAYVLTSNPFLGNSVLSAGIITVNRTDNPVEDLKNFGTAVKLSEVKILLSDTGDKWSAGAGSRSEEGAGDDKKMPRLSPSDVGNIADNLVRLGDALGRSKDLLQKKKSADAIIDQAGNAVNNLGINEQVQNGAAIAAALRGLVSSMAAQVQSPTMAVTMWLLTMANAVGQYATLSLAGEAAPNAEPAQQ